jgi:hypothetical protein
MAALSEIFIKEETLEVILKTIKKKGAKGIGLTISISDKSNKFGSNVSAYISQSKEDRDAKKDKFAVGYGKVFWTDGKVVKGEKPEGENTPTYSATVSDDDDLPF